MGFVKYNVFAQMCLTSLFLCFHPISASADAIRVDIPANNEVTIKPQINSGLDFEITIFQIGLNKKWQGRILDLQRTPTLNWITASPDVIIVSGTYGHAETRAESKDLRLANCATRMSAPVDALLDDPDRVIVGFDDTNGGKVLPGHYSYTNALVIFEFKPMELSKSENDTSLKNKSTTSKHGRTVNSVGCDAGASINGAQKR
jgi:hypothetical protein